MGVFNVSFASPTAKKSGGGGIKSGILKDQLQIIEAQLESDGNLAPGDLKLLQDKAQEFYGYPGLTPSQRSDFQVAVERYKSKASQYELSDLQDIEALNSDVKEDQIVIAMEHGNDPQTFIEKQSTLQFSRVQQLAESITNREQSGADTTDHVLAYDEARIEYQNTLEAMQDIERAAADEQVESNYAAHIKTNSRGEIVDVDISPRGTQSGYAEVSGVTYGGLPVFGKPRKEGETQIFNLGSNRFEAGNTFIIGEDGNPVIGSDTLVSPNLGEDGYKINTDTVRTRPMMRNGEYARGQKGFYYKKNEDGTYTKYLNADPEKLGVQETEVLPIPKQFESSITPHITTTHDFANEPEILGSPPGTIEAGQSVGGDVRQDGYAALAPAGRHD